MIYIHLQGGQVLCQSKEKCCSEWEHLVHNKQPMHIKDIFIAIFSTNYNDDQAMLSPAHDPAQTAP